MTKKLKRWIIASFASLMILFISSGMAVAQEIQQVETNGTIGFTGVYEPTGKPDPEPTGKPDPAPTGKPDPAPPESIEEPPITELAKPGGKLPQTNDISHSYLVWLGIFSIIFVILLWKRKNKQLQN